MAGIKAFVGDKEYFIIFKHVQNSNNELFAGGTVCTIVENGSNEIVGSGHSLCHRPDQFNKETGRKLALTRALEGLDRDSRRTFWDCYWHRGVQAQDAR